MRGVEATSVLLRLLPRTASYRTAARASGVIAKPWLPGLLGVCASGALTHSPVLSVVAPGARGGGGSLGLGHLRSPLPD